MPAPPNDKRDELLDAVIVELAANGIAGATIRSLAKAIGVSTYPLAYHFGSKEQLLEAVFAKAESRQRELVERLLTSSAPQDAGPYWQWCLDNRELLRLDLEILLQEGRRSPDADRPLAATAFGEFHAFWREQFAAAGYDAQRATAEATRVVDTTIGLQLDLIATGDVERTTRAFDVLQDEVRASLRRAPDPGSVP